MTILEKIYEAEKFDLSLQKKLSTLSVFADAENNFLFKLRIKKFSAIKEKLIPEMVQLINEQLRMEFKLIKRENLDAISVFSFVLYGIEDISIEKLVSRFPEIFEAMFKINQELKFRY